MERQVETPFLGRWKGTDPDTCLKGTRGCICETGAQVPGLPRVRLWLGEHCTLPVPIDYNSEGTALL